MQKVNILQGLYLCILFLFACSITSTFNQADQGVFNTSVAQTARVVLTMTSFNTSVAQTAQAILAPRTPPAIVPAGTYQASQSTLPPPVTSPVGGISQPQVIHPPLSRPLTSPLPLNYLPRTWG